MNNFSLIIMSLVVSLGLGTAKAASNLTARGMTKYDAARVPDQYKAKTDAINVRIADSYGKTCIESLNKKLEAALDIEFGSDDENKAAKDAKRAEIVARIGAALTAYMGRAIVNFNGCVQKSERSYYDKYYRDHPGVEFPPEPTLAELEPFNRGCFLKYEADVKTLFNGCIKEQIKAQGTKKHKSKKSKRR